MTQPNWKLVANIGDVNPIDHGGHFVFVDTTGVYAPEVEILLTPDDYDEFDPDDRTAIWHVYRYTLEPCTYIDGILSDNKFHPDHAAWFAKPETARAERPQDTTYLADLADAHGLTVAALVAMFTSDDTLQRAEAWRIVHDYHGLENLDAYPLALNRSEVDERYAAHPYVGAVV
jgi:hypothetical protein